MGNPYNPYITGKSLRLYDEFFDKTYDGEGFINISPFPEITGPVLVMKDNYMGKGRDTKKQKRGRN